MTPLATTTSWRRPRTSAWSRDGEQDLSLLLSGSAKRMIQVHLYREDFTLYENVSSKNDLIQRGALDDDKF